MFRSEEGQLMSPDGIKFFKTARGVRLTNQRGWDSFRRRAASTDEADDPATLIFNIESTLIRAARKKEAGMSPGALRDNFRSQTATSKAEMAVLVRAPLCRPVCALASPVRAGTPVPYSRPR